MASYALPSDVPRYIINLDAPAATRWDAVATDFADRIPAVFAEVDDVLTEMVGATASKAGQGLLSLMARIGLVMYADELKGLSRATSVPLGKLVMLQIAYEAFASCTSIVAPGAPTTAGALASSPVMIRTMDWEMEELKALAIEAHFQRGGRTVFVATTWAGYVGVLTGMKMSHGGGTGAWAASINYRRTADGTFAQNFIKGAQSSWPIGFLLRAAMEDDTTMSYADAVLTLSASALMAPTYITLAGASPGEGAVLVRDRDGVASTVGAAPSGSDAAARGSTRSASGGLPRRADLKRDGFVVQCNMDPDRAAAVDVESDWQDICESRRRFAVASAALSTSIALGGGGTTLDALWSIATLPPVHAHDTVYTVAIDPARGAYVSRASIPPSAVRKARRRWRAVQMGAERQLDAALRASGAAGSAATRQ
jgi:acid ceramidase